MFLMSLLSCQEFCLTGGRVLLFFLSPFDVHSFWTVPYLYSSTLPPFLPLSSSLSAAQTYFILSCVEQMKSRQQSARRFFSARQNEGAFMRVVHSDSIAPDIMHARRRWSRPLLSESASVRAVKLIFTVSLRLIRHGEIVWVADWCCCPATIGLAFRTLEEDKHTDTCRHTEEKKRFSLCFCFFPRSLHPFLCVSVCWLMKWAWVSSCGVLFLWKSQQAVELHHLLHNQSRYALLIWL